MRRHAQLRHAGPGRHRAREVDGVERAERGGQRIAGPAKNPSIEGHEIKGVEDLADGFARRRHLVVIERPGDPCAVEGAQALHPNELARQRASDAPPRSETARLSENDSKDDGRVDIDVHLAPRSARRSDSESSALRVRA